MISRRPQGSKNFSRSELREVLEDSRVWTGIGLVVKRPNESSHFELLKDDANNVVDVQVEVDLMPRRESITCRLGTCAAVPGGGVWKIPSPGTEVLVIIPQGNLEASPSIVAELSSRNVPDHVDETTLVVSNPDGDIQILSTGGNVIVNGSEVRLGDQHPTEQAVLGTTYTTDIQTFLTSLTIYVTAIAAIYADLTSVWTQASSDITSLSSSTALDFTHASADSGAAAAPSTALLTAISTLSSALPQALSNIVKVK